MEFFGGILAPTAFASELCSRRSAPPLGHASKVNDSLTWESLGQMSTQIKCVQSRHRGVFQDDVIFTSVQCRYDANEEDAGGPMEDDPIVEESVEAQDE